MKDLHKRAAQPDGRHCWVVVTWLCIYKQPAWGAKGVVGGTPGWIHARQGVTVLSDNSGGLAWKNRTHPSLCQLRVSLMLQHWPVNSVSRRQHRLCLRLLYMRPPLALLNFSQA